MLGTVMSNASSPGVGAEFASSKTILKTSEIISVPSVAFSSISIAPAASPGAVPEYVSPSNDSQSGNALPSAREDAKLSSSPSASINKLIGAAITNDTPVASVAPSASVVTSSNGADKIGASFTGRTVSAKSSEISTFPSEINTRKLILPEKLEGGVPLRENVIGSK